MAIELTLDKKRKMPFWLIVFAAVIAIAVLGLAGTYAYFYFSGRKMASKIEEINNSIIPLEEAIKQKEAQLILYQQRINDFKALFSKHKKVENVFTFLEKYTIPSIWFSDFSMAQGQSQSRGRGAVPETESQAAISLKGKSPSFLTIEQQVEVFSKQEEVQKVVLSSISISQEGEIEFSLEIIFNPAIFNYNFYE